MNKTINSNFILYKCSLILGIKLQIFFILLLKFCYTLDFEQTNNFNVCP